MSWKARPASRPKPSIAPTSRSAAPAVQRTECAGAAEEGAGLGGGHGETLVERDLVGATLLEGAVGLLSRAQLDDAVREPDRGACRRRAGVLGEQPVGQGEHGVARDDGGRDAEHRPGRGAVPSGPVLVDDIVVQEAEVVDQFHGHGCPHRLLRVAAHRPGRGEDERGPDRLAGLPGGRTAVGVLPAEVVHRDTPDGSGQRLDRGPKLRIDETPGALQERQCLVALGGGGVRTDHGHSGSLRSPGSGATRPGRGWCGEWVVCTGRRHGSLGP